MDIFLRLNTPLSPLWWSITTRVTIFSFNLAFAILASLQLFFLLVLARILILHANGILDACFQLLVNSL
jgi:hypothetical protein